MNKKVLTLCAGLLVASSSFSFAENIKLGTIGEQVTDLKGNGDYFMFVSKGLAYGFEEQADGSIKETIVSLNKNIDQEDLANYLWSVDSVALDGVAYSQFGYRLFNKATGKQLVFKVGTEDSGDWVDFSSTPSNELDKKGFFVFGGYKGYNKACVAGENVIFDGHQYTGTLTGTFHWMAIDNSNLYRTSQPFSLGSSEVFNFYKVNDQEIDAGDLNELYNSTGFNLAISGNDDVDNIFVNKRIKAIEVSSPVNSLESRDFAFPAGTYFVTETPKGEYSTLTTASEKYEYLMNCTFVAVSPSTNDVNDADKRKAGEGFQLVEISGRNLQKYIGTEASRKSQGEDVSVYNACFSVVRNANGNFDLGLDKIRINETATATEQKDKANLHLGVSKKVGYSDKYLATLTGNATYAFVYKEAFSKEGVSFLNVKSKAVYTFKFAAGDEEGKYLYATAYNNASVTPDIYAKGAAFVDTNMPEAQWVVTNVSDTYTVEFTNRANSNVKFSAKLYEEEGTNTYSLALTPNTISTIEVTPLNVKENGDIEKGDQFQLHKSWVVAEQVATDKFAGTWNVTDGTEVTMMFARDNTPTSNKLYVQRKVNVNGSLTNNLEVSNKLGEAIQFQLVKSVDSIVIARPYAYIDAADSKVAKFNSLGDTIAYYTYKMNPYQDGVADKDLYLNYSGGKYCLGTSKTEYVIKENVDGSVSILKAAGNAANDYAQKQALVVNNWTTEANDIDKYIGSTIILGNLQEDIHAKYVKTYLNIEAPETSLSATESYVTIKSDLGNYITMNEDRDGIMASTDPATIRVIATDTEKNIPSFYITTGWNEDGSRMFMFNPSDSVNYYVAEGSYDKKYQWDEEVNKVIFKNATLSGAKNDTLSTEIKGVKTLVADKADNNKKVQGGLDKFKYQIILAEDEDNLYWIRQNGAYLTSINGKLTFSNGTTTNAVKVYVEETSAPTANESINAANNVVVAGVNGAVVVKGAEGKNVIVSTILGKVVANEVVSSDNATIAAPQGVVVVSVDGESFKVVVK